MNEELETDVAIVWQALWSVREDLLPEDVEDEMYDQQWAEIWSAMTRLEKALGLNSGEPE